jgi:hypothetical protein
LNSNSVLQIHLKQLEEAAADHHFALCLDALTECLSFVDSQVVFQVLLKLVRQFLEMSINDSPDNHHIQHSLAQLNDSHSLDDLSTKSLMLAELLEHEAQTPGNNNYRSALRRLSRLEKFEHTAGSHETVTGIVSGLILAITDYVWGVKNPELWARAFWLRNKEDHFIRARYFVGDPEVIAMTQSLWSQVIRDIESIRD